MSKQAEIRKFKIHFAIYKRDIFEPIVLRLFPEAVQDPELNNIFRVEGKRKDILRLKDLVSLEGIKFADYCKVTELKQ